MRAIRSAITATAELLVVNLYLYLILSVACRSLPSVFMRYTALLFDVIVVCGFTAYAYTPTS